MSDQHTVQTLAPYAICLDCGREHADRRAMDDHMGQTTPSGGGSSHRQRVVTPTPEEHRRNAVQRTVRQAIEDAAYDACQDLERSIERGTVTKEEVTAEIRLYPDFSDAWAEWVAGVER